MAENEPEQSGAGIPPWTLGELPEPKPLVWRNWASFIGPGIVMMGIQIGGGEWLFGPTMTAKYGGGLMWIATIAITPMNSTSVDPAWRVCPAGEGEEGGSPHAPPTLRQRQHRPLPQPQPTGRLLPLTIRDGYPLEHPPTLTSSETIAIRTRMS
jgi:hypothetical protein